MTVTTKMNAISKKSDDVPSTASLKTVSPTPLSPLPAFGDSVLFLPSCDLVDSNIVSVVSDRGRCEVSRMEGTLLSGVLVLGCVVRDTGSALDTSLLIVAVDSSVCVSLTGRVVGPTVMSGVAVVSVVITSK